MPIRFNGPRPRVSLPRGVAAALNGAAAAPSQRARRAAARLDMFMATRPDLAPYRGASAADIGAPQYGPSFSRSGLRGLSAFGALPPEVVKQISAIAVKVGKHSVDLWNAVKDEDTWLNSKWRGYVGSDSSFSAAKTSATAQVTLAKEVSARAQRIFDTQDAKAANSFLNDAVGGEWDRSPATMAALQLLSVSGGIKDIGTGMAKDVLDPLQASGKGFLVILKYLPYILVGGVVLYGGAKYLSWRRAARAGPGIAGVTQRRRARRTRRSR